jgi:hypothetical protein
MLVETFPWPKVNIYRICIINFSWELIWNERKFVFFCGHSSQTFLFSRRWHEWKIHSSNATHNVETNRYFQGFISVPFVCISSTQFIVKWPINDEYRLEVIDRFEARKKYLKNDKIRHFFIWDFGHKNSSLSNDNSHDWCDDLAICVFMSKLFTTNNARLCWFELILVFDWRCRIVWEWGE